MVFVVAAGYAGFQFYVAAFVVGTVGTEGVDGDFRCNGFGCIRDGEFIGVFGFYIDHIFFAPWIEPEFFSIGSGSVCGGGIKTVLGIKINFSPFVDTL